MKKRHDSMQLERDGFAYVAFWQLMTFLALILMVWVNELWDLSHVYYGTEARPPNFFNASILTAAALLIAIVTIGHTYVQQKRIIKGLLTVCSYCHKIRLDHEMWEQMDDYLVDHSLASLSHGVCPDCFERVTADIESANAPPSPPAKA